MGGDAFQPLVERWCRELLPAVRSAWGLDVDRRLVVQVKTSRGLNASIVGAPESPCITVSVPLLQALATFDANLFALGCGMLVDGHAMLNASQPLMDDLVAQVVAMDPPASPAPALAARLTRPGFEAYQRSYVQAAAERLLAHGRALFATGAGARGSAADVGATISRWAQQLAEPGARAQLLECQVKFVLLHELAHLQLGHLGQPTSPETELDADRIAADVYLAFGEALRKSGELTIDTPALAMLLAAIGFVEDLMLLTDRSIDYATPAFAREAHVPLVLAHPCTRLRAKSIMGRLAPHDWAHLVAYVVDLALLELKNQFRLGVIDYSRFKWYCRVRSLEQQAQWATMKQPRGEARRQYAEMVKNETGWDSIDLQWGPLVDDIFPATWFDPVCMPTAPVR